MHLTVNTASKHPSSLSKSGTQALPSRWVVALHRKQCLTCWDRLFPLRLVSGRAGAEHARAHERQRVLHPTAEAGAATVRLQQRVCAPALACAGMLKLALLRTEAQSVARLTVELEGPMSIA